MHSDANKGDFPILWHWRRETRAELEALGCPRSVPWNLVAPHEEQAHRNHGQTLGRLAARGGLSPAELVAVLEDRPFRYMSNKEVVEDLLRLMKEGS